MSHEAIIITGGMVATEYGTLEVDIIVRNGRIAGLVEGADGIPGQRINATGLVIFPGGVDMHTHLLRRPITVEREGFSYQAAAGGITTVVEMPHGDPLVHDVDSLRQKHELAARSAIVDFGLYAAAIGQDASELVSLRHEGVLAFKAFLCKSSPGFPMLDDAALVRCLQSMHQMDTLLIVHAENDDLLQDGMARMTADGRIDPLAHAESRPPIVESEAVARAIHLARYTGARLHIAHVSTGEATHAIGEAQADGVPVTCETCPQYLVMDESDLERLGPFARCAPPLRNRADVEALWAAVADGTINAICSDHSPYSVAEKEAGITNIFQAPLGLNMIDVMLSSIVDEGIHRRGLSWTRFANLSAAEPARILGLYPTKGSIRVGADADLAIWDLDHEWEVTANTYSSERSWTPLEGRRLRGRVVRTIRRGQTIYADGAISASKGSGQFLMPGSH